MADIKVGEEILEYVEQIKLIVAKLEAAYTQLEKIETICGDKNNYEGNATEEINMFCWSQKTHLRKIMGFYNKAAQYAFEYFSEMEYTDEELTKIIISLY